VSEKENSCRKKKRRDFGGTKTRKKEGGGRCDGGQRFLIGDLINFVSGCGPVEEQQKEGKV